MSVYNFDTPSRQSLKGIVVIFGYSIYKVIRATIIIIAAFFIKYFQSDKEFNLTSPKFIISISCFILFFLVLAILKYRNFMFHVDSSYFILNKGIINKEEVSVATSKIQNVYIKQNVLQQLINVVSLAIETAGDDKTEIEISALEKPKAIALKALLLSDNKAVVGDKIPQDTTSIFFKASLKRLFLEGISENHFKSFVLIFAFIMSVYNDLKEFVEQLNISSRFNSWFALDAESFMGLLLLNVFIVLLLIIVSFLFSLVKTVIQNFDLTVVRNLDGLEISKGLFNKINLSLKSSRIQTVTVATNRFKRILGLYQLAFTQAMVNKKQKQKFNIIGLSLSKINALLEEFYPKALNNTVKQKPNKYMIYKVFFIATLPIIALNIFLFYFPITAYLINIPIVGIIVLSAFYSYKKKYYSIDDNYIVIGGGGFIDTTTSILEIHKVQGVSLIQTVFQKQRGLASVKLYSAGKFLTIPHICLKTAQDITNYLLFKVESEDRDWM